MISIALTPDRLSGGGGGEGGRIFDMIPVEEELK